MHERIAPFSPQHGRLSAAGSAVPASSETDSSLPRFFPLPAGRRQDRPGAYARLHNRLPEWRSVQTVFKYIFIFHCFQLAVF